MGNLCVHCCVEGASEIKLDSDEEQGAEESSTTSAERKNSGEYSSPFETSAPKAPEAAAVAAKEDTPQISVSQTSVSSASKVSTASKSSRDEVMAADCV
jgi:hypothetical protein